MLSVDLEGLALPVFAEPANAALVFFLELFGRVATRLNDVRDERHEAWALATLRHQAELDLLDAYDLVLFDDLLVERQVVVEVALRLE